MCWKHESSQLKTIEKWAHPKTKHSKDLVNIVTKDWLSVFLTSPKRAKAEADQEPTSSHHNSPTSPLASSFPCSWSLHMAHKQKQQIVTFSPTLMAFFASHLKPSSENVRVTYNTLGFFFLQYGLSDASLSHTYFPSLSRHLGITRVAERFYL